MHKTTIIKIITKTKNKLNIKSYIQEPIKKYL
jgi:hypothetical protein